MNPPTLPQLGTITAFTYRDGIGRIKLDDGTELKVGSAGLKGLVSFLAEERPLVGVRVMVEEVAPHPLGGFRAMKTSRVGKEVTFEGVSTPAQWEAKLREAGLAKPHAAKIRKAFRPAGRLVGKEGPVALAGSKVGGQPDVPADFEWPMLEGEPFGFFGQLQLSDVPASVTGDLDLPRKGLLAFFLGAESEDEVPVGRVILVRAATKQLAPSTHDDEPAFEATALAVHEIWTPPPYEVVSRIVGEDATAMRIYEAAFADHERAIDGVAQHRLGGHAMPVQDSPERDDERLLLQIDSDDACELMWGDAGRLYFLIGRSAGLDRLRCELQSH